MENTKWCPQCEDHRPVAEFYLSSRGDGLSSYCAMHHLEATRASYRRKRLEFIEAMGGKCEQCGFADDRALQVDHIAGNGRTARLVTGAATQRFYRAVLAHREDYALLCANCNQIKKFEQDETRGERVYPRRIPTERKKGIGKGNAPAQRAALERARTPEHQAAAGRAKKGKPNPKVAAARRGTKLVDGHWVRPD
jgi:hypothetical protein